MVPADHPQVTYQHASALVDVSSVAPIVVVVVARAGLMCESLVTFLQGIPDVQIAGVFTQASGVLATVRAQAPQAVVVDTNLGQAVVLSLLRDLRSASESVRCIVLTDDVWQPGMYLAAGADTVLLKGFLDGPLRQAVLDSRQSA